VHLNSCSSSYFQMARLTTLRISYQRRKSTTLIVSTDQIHVSVKSLLYYLLGCYSKYAGRQVLTFWRKHCCLHLHSLIPNMEAAGAFKTLVPIYHLHEVTFQQTSIPNVLKTLNFTKILHSCSWFSNAGFKHGSSCSR
jgi:hypothetical protein